MSTVEERLKSLNITIPTPAAPVANYVGHMITGNLVFVSGQIPFKDGVVAITGKVGFHRTMEEGYEAARLCALNVIAQVKVACGGDLDRVVRVVRVGGFINGMADFVDAPKCVNGASDLFVQVFGERGKHARTALIVNSLPANATAEVEAVVEIR